MDKEKLANNNLVAQLELYCDIYKNYLRIVNHIEEKGFVISNIIRGSKKLESGEVVLSKENYEVILEISHILSNRKRYENLGILAKTAVPDNEIKLEIISILTRS